MRLIPILICGVTIAVLAAKPTRADLVLNGGFETGTLASWSASDASIFIDDTFPNTDAFDAAFTGNGLLSQQLLTTAGQDYILSFAVEDEAASVLDTFQVKLGRFSANITGDQAPGSYIIETLTVPGVDITGTTTLSFQAANPQVAWNLDDVSVTPAPRVSAPEPPVGTILAGAALLLLTLRLRGRTNIG
jgi:hypothetical protein